jgi:hypothetical protein
MDFTSERNNSTNKTKTNKKYSTIKEYLETLVYPSLQESIMQLIDHIKTSKDQLEERLTKQFKIRFYQINNDYHKKQKELLKLERGDDYSETDYDYYMKGVNEINESKSENEENENDLDFEELNDEDLENIKQQLENEDVEKSFNPIMFLAEALRLINKKNKEDHVSKQSENDFLNEDENNLDNHEESEHS